MRPEHHRTRLGRAIGVGHLGLRQRAVDRRHQACAHRRRAHADELHARQIGLRQRLRLAQHHGDHRRHRGQPGRPIAADRLDVGARLEARQQHDGGMRGAGELGERQRVHVVERRRDQDSGGARARASAASRPPRCGSGATARRPWARRSSPRCRGTSPARRVSGSTVSNTPGSRKRSKPSRLSSPKQTFGRSSGQFSRLALSQNTSLRAGILDDEIDGLARKPVVHRHRDQARAHDAEISGEIFGAVGGQDGDALAAREAALCERARHAHGHGVELGVGEFARHLFAAEIDDRELGIDRGRAGSDRRGFETSPSACSHYPFGGGGGAVK